MTDANAGEALRNEPLARCAMGPQREADLIERWAAGAWRDTALIASDGAAYTVLYEGRRGGNAGPDFCDAVLVGPGGQRVYGDIELHLRAANWRAHGHERDAR